MKRVDSDALGVITRSLGLSGVGAQETEFLDGELVQTLDVSRLIRRGRTLAASTGIYTAVMSNVHTDAETLASTLDLYVPAAAAIAGSTYPNPVPRQFEVWVLGATLQQISGGGTLSGALFIDYPANQQGLGINDSGAGVVASSPNPLAFWDAIEVEHQNFGILTGTNGPRAQFAIRAPRGADLIFGTTSSLTTSFNCQLIVGLFPIGLGQDGVEI